MIDSVYFPDELELLPNLLAQAGFAIDGLLCTHADFDHLLGRLAFSDKTLGVGQSTARRLRASPGESQRELRDADAEFYVHRQRPLSLAAVQELPVPGYIELGELAVELHPADGHTGDGTAFFARELGVLACGDYLSDVEIPVLGSGGTVACYRATLERLAPLCEACETVVPGHGSPSDGASALRILEADLLYLDSLERGDEHGQIPADRDSHRQRQIHRDNLLRCATS